MKISGILVIAALLSACGADPWVGSYGGTVESSGIDCATGDALPVDVQDVTIDIMRGGSGLFVAGMCRVPLREDSDSFATVLPTVCHFAASDGTLMTFDITAGQFARNGSRLSGFYAGRLTEDHGAFCVEARADVDANRL